MDKTKTGILAGLAVLVGLTLFQRMQDPPLPSEGDDDDHPAAKTATKADPALVGNVKTLQIKDLAVGTGPAAKTGDSVQVQYTGSLLNGNVFDSNVGKAPFSVTLGQGQVIKGWDQGLVGMKVGGKRKLTIPAALGYGDQGQGEKIPGGATLVFEVDLLSIGKTT